ncbi:NAD-dependent deacetylase hst3, partial [Linderina pennispora]
ALDAKRALQRANSARRRQALDKTFTKAVQLHGDLENVVCTICFTKYPFTEQLAEEFREGAPPPCPHCKEIETLRDLVGKRSIAAGVLRPDIVLYNECHPQGDVIGALSEFDLRRRPDLLIVIGTSLKIPGVKRMVKEMSRCVQSCTVRAKRAGAGKAIFINRDDPPKGWDSVFDFFIAGDSDDAVSHLPLTQEGAEEDRSVMAIKQRMAIETICDMGDGNVAGKPLAEESEADSSDDSDTQVPVRRPRSRKPKDTTRAQTGTKRRGRSQPRTKKLTTSMGVVKAKNTSSAGKRKPNMPMKLTRSASAAAVFST